MRTTFKEKTSEDHKQSQPQTRRYLGLVKLLSRNVLVFDQEVKVMLRQTLAIFGTQEHPIQIVDLAIWKK